MKPISIEEGDWGDPNSDDPNPYRFKITFDAICPENQVRFTRTLEEAHTLFAMMRLGFHEDQINEMLRPERKKNIHPWGSGFFTGFMGFENPDD